MYRLETTPDFEKDFKSLEKDVAGRVTKKIEWLAENPEAIRFPLKHAPKDLKGLQKYRIGDYRVLLWVDHGKRAIILYGVEHRRSVYERL
jgi:mRNA interferase RelE/StbE